MLESHFEIFRGTDTLYHYHLRNQNADVLLTGHPYFFKPGCYIGIMNIRAHTQPQYFTRIDAPCGFSFCIHDATAEVIAHGGSYCSASEREQAIQEVLALAKNAPVVYLGSIVSAEVSVM